MQVIAKSHAVTATKIVSVQPVRRGDQLMHPDDGIVLVLEDGKKHKWIIEDGITPLAGDMFVSDADLHAMYVVNAAKFSELFTVNG
jgi:hypothetical protein